MTPNGGIMNIATVMDAMYDVAEFLWNRIRLRMRRSDWTMDGN